LYLLLDPSPSIEADTIAAKDGGVYAKPRWIGDPDVNEEIHNKAGSLKVDTHGGKGFGLDGGGFEKGNGSGVEHEYDTSKAIGMGASCHNGGLTYSHC
jgi:hypothetical protein